MNETPETTVIETTTVDAPTAEAPVLNLREMIITALDKHLVSGLVEKTIAAKIEKTVQEILNDELNEYSDFGRKLKDSVKAAVNIEGMLGIPGYNELVLKIIKQNLDAKLEESLQRQLKTQLDDLLETAPAEIKLSDLVKQFIEAQHDKDALQGGEISLFVRDDGNGFVYVSLDPKRVRTEWECDYRIGFSKLECFSLQFGKQDVRNKLFVGPLYGFAKTVFQFYTAKTRLVMDVDPSDIDLSYDERDSDDY